MYDPLKYVDLRDVESLITKDQRQLRIGALIAFSDFCNRFEVSLVGFSDIELMSLDNNELAILYTRLESTIDDMLSLLRAEPISN